MNFNNIKTPFIGKLIGFFAGAILFPPFGALLGLAIGHFVDLHLARTMPRDKAAQVVYLDGLFSCLGYIAKLDGQVSRLEINYADTLMLRLHLTANHRETAMRSFYKGKHPGFDIDAAVHQVRQSAGDHTKLLYVFINAQVQMAYADGVVKEQLKPMLQQMAKQLGLAALSFSYYDAIFGWQQRWQYHQQRQYYQPGDEFSSYSQQATGRNPFVGTLDEAYKALALSTKATNDEVKKAYRKLMSKYHPDKLMSKGLSEQEMRQATEKVQRIKAAYEQIQRSRGL